MEKDKDLSVLKINFTNYTTRLSDKFRNRKLYTTPDPKIIVSFIPGSVLDILIKEGQNVKKGDDLMILDAMKMQNRLKCLTDGTVKKIFVNKGDKVSKGSVLIEMK